MAEEISVLVVDDHALFRRGVIQTIEEEADMSVAGEAETAAAATDRARELLPDVVLLDIKLPDRSGLSVVGTLQRECPYSKIVMLTAVEDEDALLRALKEGAHGYVLKGVSAEELMQVVRSVCHGETYVTPSMAGRLLTELTSPSESRTAGALIGELTERERTILDLVAQGKTNKEIATVLFLSEKTVKSYMTNVLQKLQVRNRVEAALSVQPILSDVGDIEEIDTSDPPNPEMHDKTIADAVTSGQATVVVFATPAFCLSQICGPTKSIIDELYESYGDQANFVHVEPYDLEKARSGEGLEPLPLLEEEWGLLTEPWVFVVDRDGTVAAKFEAVVSHVEVEEALKQIL